MSGLLSRTVRRRAAPPEPDPAQAVQDGQRSVRGEASGTQSRRERGRLRRRVRHVRRLRELQLRDLGGLVFDLYRFGEQRDPLVRQKLDAVLATDREVRQLDRLLDERRSLREVRQPGLKACPECGALLESVARFCSDCGTEQGRRAAAGDRPAAPGYASGGEASLPHETAVESPKRPPEAPDAATTQDTEEGWDAAHEPAPVAPAGDAEEYAPLPPDPGDGDGDGERENDGERDREGEIDGHDGERDDGDDGQDEDAAAVPPAPEPAGPEPPAAAPPEEQR